MKTKDTKRHEAQERQAAYDKLSPSEKLARALKRGHSGTKEVAKLRKAQD